MTSSFQLVDVIFGAGSRAIIPSSPWKWNGKTTLEWNRQFSRVQQSTMKCARPVANQMLNYLTR